MCRFSYDKAVAGNKKFLILDGKRIKVSNEYPEEKDNNLVAQSLRLLPVLRREEENHNHQGNSKYKE